MYIKEDFNWINRARVLIQWRNFVKTLMKNHLFEPLKMYRPAEYQLPEHDSESCSELLIRLTVVVHVDGVRLCLWTAATNGPIVHSPGHIWE
jgi:hypothetical protein